MPLPPPPTPVLAAGTFQLDANDDAALGVQASETFKATAANNNTVLGESGETMGFAKKQYGSTRAEVAQGLAGLSAQLQHLNDLKSPLQRADQAVEKNQINLANNQKARAELGQRNEANAAQHDHLDRTDAIYQSTLTEALEAQQQLAPIREQLAAFEQSDDGKAIAYLQAMQKSDKDVANSSANLYVDSATMSIPSEGGDRSLLTRAVASTSVDKLIGTGSIAEEKFGQTADGGVMGISLQADGAGVNSQHASAPGVEKKTCFLKADYQSAEVQKGLYDLEAVDYITGQIDRHPGNIFVDPQSGKVTGIDNDLAFPEASRELMASRENQFKGVQNLPMFLHQDTASKILQTSPEKLAAELRNLSYPGQPDQGKLSEAEIQGAVGRLKELQDAIRHPELHPGAPMVVSQFNQGTYNAAIERQRQMFNSKPDLGPGENFDNTVSDTALNSCPKTSYVGSVACAEKIVAAGKINAPDKFGDRPKESATKAVRHEEYAANHTQTQELASHLAKTALAGEKLNGLQEGQRARIATAADQVNSSLGQLQKYDQLEKPLKREVQKLERELNDLQQQKNFAEQRLNPPEGGRTPGFIEAARLRSEIKGLDKDIAKTSSALNNVRGDLHSQVELPREKTLLQLDQRKEKLNTASQEVAQTFNQNIGQLNIADPRQGRQQNLRAAHEAQQREAEGDVSVRANWNIKKERTPKADGENATRNFLSNNHRNNNNNQPAVEESNNAAVKAKRSSSKLS